MHRLIAAGSLDGQLPILVRDDDAFDFVHLGEQRRHGECGRTSADDEQSD